MKDFLAWVEKRYPTVQNFTSLPLGFRMGVYNEYCILELNTFILCYVDEWRNPKYKSLHLTSSEDGILHVNYRDMISYIFISHNVVNYGTI